MNTMTATQIANKLDISRSYLYYLKNNGVFNGSLSISVDEKINK